MGWWGASLVGLWLTAALGVLMALAAGTLAAGLALVAYRFGRSGERRRPRTGAHRSREPAVAAVLALTAVALGVVCGALATAARTATRDADPLASLARKRAVVRVEATVSDDPRRVTSGAGPPTYLVPAQLTRVVTADTDVRLDVAVLVFGSTESWRPLLPSQSITVVGELAPPRGGDLTAAVISARGDPTLVGRPSWTQVAAGRLRAGLQASCQTLPPGPGGLLPGLVLGDTSRLDAGVEDEFRTTGLTHLVAVSGANVAIVLGVVLFFARWCRAGPRLAAGVCLLALIGFVILARPSPSVVRAAVMGAVGLLALAAGRRRAAAPALAVAVIAGLLWDPSLSADPGFALSTLATGALILLAPRWRDGLRARGLPAWAAEALAVPAAAQVACGPVIVMLSGGVSLVAVPANLLAAPAVAPATLLGVASTLVTPLWTPLGRGLAWLAMWPARWLLTVAHVGAGIPDATLPWPGGATGGALLAAVTAGLLVAPRWPAVTRVVIVGGLAVAVGAVPVRVFASGWPPAGAVMVVCDVGQGDAIVLPVAAHEAIVVDTGPEPTAVDGCLRRLGVLTVDLLVLTHFHLDHVGGVAGLIDGRRVLALLESPFHDPPEGEHLVRSTLAGIPVIEAAPGWTYNRSDLRLTVLAPITRRTGTHSDPNNNSVVLRVISDGVSMLLAGDAETEEQQDLRALDPALIRADVLKVAHHGSAFQDPAFLDEVAPRVALVSVGAGNPYGHPNAAVLARLAGSGATVLRTDRDGDCAVVVTPTGLAVAVRRPP
jgi:competence protein ComEC